jgi:phenylpropionate dioxygenase-like ring-hydroxylating dioxygenase large terminal subunit
MAPISKSDLGLDDAAGNGPSQTENSPSRALPSSWYTSPEMFELERRAIFSRKWLLTSHTLRFHKTGDWLRYDIAGFSFILVRDKEGAVNAFHNVCRHRAFPVVTEDGGTSRIFSCKYHGWSYGLNGKLAKAPHYQDLDGFDKSKNGLLPIHVHTDVNGFIWVNLDGSENPEISWEDDFKGIDLQARFKDFNFEDYTFDHIWELNGDYNWKILADSYNECYHSIDAQKGSLIHDPNTTPEEIAQGLKIASTYYFPNSSMTVSPNFFFMQRFVPTSATSCSMRYEVYRKKDSSDEDFEMINSIFKRIMSEDKDLFENAQKNLNSGVFVSGELHPRLEKGSLYFQNVVRDLVTEFHKREEEAGHEIWPSRQTLPSDAKTSQDDIDFCSKLKGQANSDCSIQVGGGCGGVAACHSSNPELAY